MILLQLSAGQGPEECAKAVGLAYRTLLKEAQDSNVNATAVETVASANAGCFKSVLLKLEGTAASVIADNWDGVMLWICASPFRPGHRRKNWYFSGKRFNSHAEPGGYKNHGEIRFKTCRASGAGGQHVNTTDSAVQATHVATGLSVRVESERSQHANKRLARLLIMHKLQQLNAQNTAKQDKNRWAQHWDLQRGNPKRVFVGTAFKSQAP